MQENIVTLTIYAGRAGDRNARAMQGARSLGAAVGRYLGIDTEMVCSDMPLIEGGWAEQLVSARPDLQQLSACMTAMLKQGRRPLVTTNRCAASLATLPAVSHYFPSAAVIWFDAHGDCNTPVEGETPAEAYLGGMVLSGAAGEWVTGLGCGLDISNVVLVGSRELDPHELARILSGEISLVEVGENLGRRLSNVIRGRQVYIHLDCDVLDAGLIASEYQVDGGLSYSDLREAFEVLSGHDVIGLEISEYEDSWPDGGSNHPDDLIAAIEPVLTNLRAA